MQAGRVSEFGKTVYLVPWSELYHTSSWSGEPWSGIEACPKAFKQFLEFHIIGFY